MILHPLISALLSGVLLRAGASDGMVRVSVVDMVGNPIQDALVRADSMNPGVKASLVPECLTDKIGRCSIEHLAPGKYTVNAGKEEAGYAETFIPLYRHGEPPKIFTITAQNQTIEVRLTLGPIAASIDLSVIDGTTGSEIKIPP